MSGSIIDKFVQPVVVGVTTVILLGLLSLYNDVQANTKARITAEQKEQILVDMNRSLTRMEQDLKYLRNDVDELKEGQKDLTSQILEDRNRQLRPWEYQSKKE